MELVVRICGLCRSCPPESLAPGGSGLKGYTVAAGGASSLEGRGKVPPDWMPAGGCGAEDLLFPGKVPVILPCPIWPPEGKLACFGLEGTGGGTLTVFLTAL